MLQNWNEDYIVISEWRQIGWSNNTDFSNQSLCQTADTMMISHESERMPNGWRKYYTIKGRGQGDIHISLELKFKKKQRWCLFLFDRDIMPHRLYLPLKIIWKVVWFRCPLKAQDLPLISALTITFTCIAKFQKYTSINDRICTYWMVNVEQLLSYWDVL